MKYFNPVKIIVCEVVFRVITGGAVVRGNVDMKIVGFDVEVEGLLEHEEF